jgi:Flp pilus assembly protein TadD
MQLVPDFDQSYLNLARLYAVRNQRDKATAVLQELLHQQPQNTAATKALEMLK